MKQTDLFPLCSFLFFCKKFPSTFFQRFFPHFFDCLLPIIHETFRSSFFQCFLPCFLVFSVLLSSFIQKLPSFSEFSFLFFFESIFPCLFCFFCFVFLFFLGKLPFLCLFCVSFLVFCEFPSQLFIKRLFPFFGVLYSVFFLKFHSRDCNWTRTYDNLFISKNLTIFPNCLQSLPVLSKEFLDIQAPKECGFTLKRVRDMIRTYSFLPLFFEISFLPLFF